MQGALLTRAPADLRAAGELAGRTLAHAQCASQWLQLLADKGAACSLEVAWGRSKWSGTTTLDGLGYSGNVLLYHMLKGQHLKRDPSEQRAGAVQSAASYPNLQVDAWNLRHS